MFDLLLFMVVYISCMWFLTPRVFRITDTLCARQRWNFKQNIPLPQQKYSRGEEEIDQFFHSLARAIRSHEPARDAVIRHLHLLPTTALWNEFATHIRASSPMSDLMARLQHSGDEIASLFAITYANGNFHPDALDHAAQIVSDRRHVQQSLAASTAQARLTMRILTTLPFAVLIVGIVCSSRLRAHITSSAFFIVLAIGIFLNRCGARWMSRSIRRTIHSQQAPQSIALLDSLCVAVRAGHSLFESCVKWEHVNGLGAEVGQRLHNGASLIDALRPLASSRHPFDALVANTLVTAQHDGQPIRTTATILASEARKTQQAEIDARIRELPTRLALPLVFCVLPSFGLLVLAPLLIAHVSNFVSVLPSSNS